MASIQPSARPRRLIHFLGSDLGPNNRRTLDCVPPALGREELSLFLAVAQPASLRKFDSTVVSTALTLTGRCLPIVGPRPPTEDWSVESTASNTRFEKRRANHWLD